MDKKMFCDIGNKIDEYIGKCDKLSDFASELCDTICVCYPGDFILDYLVDCVAEMVGDEDGLIDEFIYERPLRFPRGGKEVEICSWPELWDFLENNENNY